MQLTSEQASYWITDIRKNISELENPEHSLEWKLKYLSIQYFLLFQLSSAIDGKVRFVGVPQD